MEDKLKKYKQKRNFKKTKEPDGKIGLSKNKLRFVVQHHLATRDHYDFRLEWQGTLKSWAVPKGPSYNTIDKRLAIEVEDHPLGYRHFEGLIPKGQYGGGTVMLWDEGFWEPLNNVAKGLKDGSLKFVLKGKRLKGTWALVRMQDNNWLLIKEKDEFTDINFNIEKYDTGIRSNKTMREIGVGLDKDPVIEGIKISSPDKIVFEEQGITKKDIVLYYQKVATRMLPFLRKRIISTVRCPSGVGNECFFMKHLGNNKGLGVVNIPEDYYYIKNITGLILEVQMNTIEFHIWSSKVASLDKPDIMVFDLDPDENMDIRKVRKGVKDLKSLLDDLGLESFLKTSGGKGYHIVVPLQASSNWQTFREFAKNIAKIMEAKWPDRYVSNIRKINRKDKIFIDWLRNNKGATSVAPYSLRNKKRATVSMPITWKELDTVAPDSITMTDALKRLNRKDPWEHFFKCQQKLK